MSHLIAPIVLVLVGVVAGAAAAIAFARRAAPRRRRRSKAAPPLTRIDAHLSAATPGLGIPAVSTSAMRRDVESSAQATEARDAVERLDRMLRDIRDLTGADETIFWRWTDTPRENLLPSAWSTEDSPRPAFFDVGAWSPLVRWSAEERVVHFAGDVEGLPVLASAPVVTADRLLGVLSVSGADGLAMGRDTARAWLPRFASQVASAIELLDLRGKYAKQWRQSKALLEAVHHLHRQKTAESLGAALCTTACDVTSAQAAILVRWQGATRDDEGHGVVQAVAGRTSAAVTVGDRVATDTLVGRACQEKLPTVLSDARAATASRSALGTAGGTVPSLAITPVGGEEVIGAIVVEGARVGAIDQHEATNVSLLAAAAKGPLEIVWETEAFALRARTDPLTELSNRRHFDEQLARVVADRDRYGKECSVIIVDLDHFKLVNDTHGHDAGDEALKHVAALMRETVRASDICARYGGEELVILLSQTGAVGAFDLAERLRARLEATPVRYGGAEIPLTASFGIATYPKPVPYADWLLLAADRALYEAKQAGRNCVKAVSASAVTPDLYKARR